MKAKLLLISTLVLALALASVWAVAAQGPEPPYGLEEGPYVPGGPEGPYWKSPEGFWFMPEGRAPAPQITGVSPQATGGPDDFGYTWDDSVPLNWIDATSGIDTGMSGFGWGQKVGPILLPFAFKYYENTYSSLYIAASGYLAFTDEGTWPSQSRVPSPAKPNNVIAPYATLVYLATSGPANRVYYTTGGTPPNRYFVVEWHDVKGGPPSDSVGGDDTYRFEVVLYENGDILFQYQTMTYNGSYYCSSAGIEDSTGLDGLNYVPFCQKAPSNKAVRFYRPTPSARVRVYPHQGRFTSAGATETFQVLIRNTGELSADTYDLTVSSAWPATLYVADGTTPLTDTDGDGTVDTGSLAQGSTFIVTVKVQTPAMVNVGDDNTANITVRSSLNTSKSKTVTLQTAIPAPFTQVYRDDADGAMSLYLVQPVAQAVKKATANYYYGYEMSVAEMPGGNFVYLWNRGRCLDINCNVYVREIEYTLLDRYGNITRAVSKLTAHSAAAMSTSDNSHAVAVALNGRIGVVWYRYLWDSSTSRFNYNIWFAILDSSGNLVYGPANLTNNNIWGTWRDYGVPRFYSPRIAATADNRFVLAWERGSRESAGGLDDIYYAIRGTNGEEVKSVTKFTAGVAGSKYYYSPGLAALSGNRALLVYEAPSGIAYAVLDSGGNTVKAETSTGYHGWDPDAVQLSSGNIVVAWWTVGNGVIQFTVLDGATYNVAAGPTTLNNPAAPTGDAYVSVAADAAGHAILTWMDADWSYRSNLYYALVDGSGTVLTPPMIFRTSQAASPYIETSYEGYGNTSYSWTPPAGVDGIAAFSAPLFGGPPGGNAAVGIRTANHGTTTATNVVLTATLGSGLTYVGDTSGIAPTVSGNNVVWNLPDLGFLKDFNFTLYVQVPSAAEYGTRYPITLTLTSAGPEGNSSDNTASAQVMAARQVFLPLILKGY